MLPKSERLTTKETERLSKGKSVFGTLISMRFIESETTKFGVAISKKIAPTAVLRNKMRRKTYALLEDVASRLRKPVFAQLILKREFAEAADSQLKDEIAAIFKKAGFLA